MSYQTATNQSRRLGKGSFHPAHACMLQADQLASLASRLAMCQLQIPPLLFFPSGCPKVQPNMNNGSLKAAE